jgi:tRNA 2-selenouridine synthase
VVIDIPKPARIARLVRDYTGIDHALLVEATERIRRRLGGQVTKEALTALAQLDYARVADLTLDYYDKAYQHGVSTRPAGKVQTVPISGDDPAATARLLVDWANSAG